MKSSAFSISLFCLFQIAFASSLMPASAAAQSYLYDAHGQTHLVPTTAKFWNTKSSRPMGLSRLFHHHQESRPHVAMEVPEVQYGLNAGFPQFGQVTHSVWYNGPKFGPGQNSRAGKRCGSAGSDCSNGQSCDAGLGWPQEATQPVEHFVGEEIQLGASRKSGTIQELMSKNFSRPVGIAVRGTESVHPSVYQSANVTSGKSGASQPQRQALNSVSNLNR